MIATLRGEVLSKKGAFVVVEVSGVGFGVQVPDRLALTLNTGEMTLLHTATVVREDSISLFGFGTSEELELFDLLCSVSGVGPKSALAILSQVTPEEIAEAIVGERDEVFRQVSGIGPKTAKLIVLSLHGAFDIAKPKVSAGAATTASDATRLAVIQALVGLGWTDRVAKSGVQQALELDPDSGVDTSKLLRAALGILGPHTNREGRG